MASLHLSTLVVSDYDEAIEFFTSVLDFDLIEDKPSLTNDGRPKRWVEVKPKGSDSGLLLAKADGETQQAVVGSQCAGRVSFFLQVDNFDVIYKQLVDSGVQIVGEPRDEDYGRVVVFHDVAGNKWDLLGPSTK